MRQTLARFEAGLDPEQFVRIHRGTIVRADLVRELTHRSNGDADLRLEDGTVLRLSRSYRAATQGRFPVAQPGRAAPGADGQAAPWEADGLGR